MREYTRLENVGISVTVLTYNVRVLCQSVCMECGKHWQTSKVNIDFILPP